MSELASEEGPRRGRLGRRRRANVAGGRQHSHRVLVTPEEEARLVRLAESARVTVPRLLIEAALAVGAGGGETPTQRRDAMAELFAVRRLLAAVSNNVNQIARHANAGEQFPADATQDVVVGYSVTVKPARGERPVWFGGGSAGGEPWPGQQQPGPAQAADELRLRPARGRDSTYGAFQPGPARLGRAVTGGAGQLGRLHPPGPPADRAALQHLQPVPALKLPGQRLRPRPVVPHIGLGAVLAHQRHRQMDVVVARRGQPVPHRHPPARGLRPAGTAGLGEAHPVDEVGGDRRPPLVGQLALLGAQRQRAVPHRPARHLHLVRAPGMVQFPGDPQRIGVRQLGVVVPGHDRRVAGDQVRLGVLVRLARPGQVGQQPAHPLPAGDVRHHRRITAASPSSHVPGQLVDRVVDAQHNPAHGGQRRAAAGRDAALGGLGLYLVADICADHDWTADGERKHVWAQLPQSG